MHRKISQISIFLTHHCFCPKRQCECRPLPRRRHSSKQPPQAAMMLRPQWLLQNTAPSCPPVIIPDLHKLTLRLSLTRVRRELWHLLLFVNRSRWKHRCGKTASHDAYRSACLMLAAPIDESRRNNWALFQERQHGPFRVWVYQPLPVNPQQGELCNPLSVHCGQPLYLGRGGGASVGVLRRDIVTALRPGSQLTDIRHLVINWKPFKGVGPCAQLPVKTTSN